MKTKNFLSFFYVLLVTLVVSSNAVMAEHPSNSLMIPSSTQTETFESEISGATSFTGPDGTAFTVSGLFDIEEWANAGAGASNKFIDNTGNAGVVGGTIGAIESADKNFKVYSVDLFLSYDAYHTINQVATGTIKGYLDGSLVFTYDLSVDPSQDARDPQYFYHINLSTVSSYEIDKLEFNSVSVVNYYAIDDFEYVSISPNVAPTITVNKGLTIDEGATASIPLDSLEADDADSNNASLSFVITSASTNGQIENTDNPGVAISSFTQQNLIDGKIQYVHDGSNTTSDSFGFKVSDGSKELTDQTFSITVNAVYDNPPVIVLDSIKSIGITSAVVFATISDLGDGANNVRGFCYATTTAPTVENDTLGLSVASISDFSEDLTGLTNNTQYFVRAYIVNDNDTVYSNEINFMTEDYPTSLSEKTVSYKLYPNPVTATLNIENAGGKSYRIFNMTGKEIMAGVYSSSIHTGGLNSGVYFVVIDNYRQQFIKE